MERVIAFRMISNEDPAFIRDYSVPARQNFLVFHHLIQENLDYDKDQIASFFICNDSWEKLTEITLFEVMDETHTEILVMEAVKLDDLIREPGQKLLYMYDVFSERVFFMEVMEIIESEENGSPKVLHEQGEPPQQIVLDPSDDLTYPGDYFPDEDAGSPEDEDDFNQFPSDYE